MQNPETCEHDNFEPLTDEVNWCPDCGTQWAQNCEQIARVHELFMRKLTERYPDHPWVRLNVTK